MRNEMIQQVLYHCNFQWDSSTRKKRKKKTIFLTRWNLFEYVIMFFDLYNAFETFQSFINVILRKYLNEFCIVYVNDILMYNNIKEKHVNHIRKIFVKLKQIELFFNINKCEFFVTQVKYLNMIITIENKRWIQKK